MMILEEHVQNPNNTTLDKIEPGECYERYSNLYIASSQHGEHEQRRVTKLATGTSLLISPNTEVKRINARIVWSHKS